MNQQRLTHFVICKFFLFFLIDSLIDNLVLRKGERNTKEDIGCHDTSVEMWVSKQ